MLLSRYYNVLGGGLSARRRLYLLGDRHAADVFRAGFAPYENDLLAALGPLFGFRSRENHAPGGGSGDGVDAGGENFGAKRVPVDLAIDDRIKKTLDVLRLDAQESFLASDQFLVGHVHSPSESR